MRSYVNAAKGDADIPISLSEDACGNDSRRWRRRLVLLRVQERRLRSWLRGVQSELGRNMGRQENCRRALEVDSE